MGNKTTSDTTDPIDTDQIAKLRPAVASIQAEIDQKYESRLLKKSPKENGLPV
ncbi:MAG: hypothetical protein R3E08_12410 [Thiotrichaceae bacterium]